MGYEIPFNRRFYEYDAQGSYGVSELILYQTEDGMDIRR